MRMFNRYIGIDYSGAQTPDSSLPGLRAYMADSDSKPYEDSPPPSPRKYWTRHGLAEWLATILRETPRTIVGIDHGFSFPIAYFEKYKLEQDWDNFLSDFCAHWPTDAANTYVDFVRDGTCGRGVNRQGNSKWRRLAEIRTPHTHSVFHFDVQGQVAKSTHAGIPWLRYLRRGIPSIHFWPFDGWTPRNGSHVVAEVYPSLWRNLYPTEGRTRDQQDAYAVCRWLLETDRADNLKIYFSPSLSPDEQVVARIEGWILGVGPVR
jgi:hypothetical protein